MSESETVSLTHTPGPWEAKTRDEWEGGFDFFGGEDGAFVFMADVEPEDILLISAAPDMLAALKNLEVYAGVQLRWHRGAQDDHVWESILAAIAKAEGRTSA